MTGIVAPDAPPLRNPPPLPKADQVRAMLAQAVRHHQAGKLQQAVRVYGQALALDSPWRPAEDTMLVDETVPVA